MKGLTYSAMAAARLRANKRSYVSLVIGIFLAIFLITVIFLAIQGFLLAQMNKTDAEVGKLEAFLVDTPEITDQALADSGLFTEIGHVYITAQAEDSNTYIGYYDHTAHNHMNRILLEGRLPETAGEIAVEQGTLLSLDLDREWTPGDTVELKLTPIDGTEEVRSFTLVGILKDQAQKLDPTKEWGGGGANVKQFPAILVSPQEPAFSTGRIAVHRTFLVSGGIFAREIIVDFYATAGKGFGFGDMYCLTLSGEPTAVWDTEEMFFSDESFTLPLVLGLLLAAALIVSCCIGISLAMEGVLAKQSEQVGMLRAVGATKRQIRRIFGRESILLAVIVSPVSVLLGVVVVWIFSLLVPEQMVMYPNPWLLLPIAALSACMILLASFLPLCRCANKMPMSVVRDTAVLRKIKRIKSSKRFCVSRLISMRLLRLYPSKQIGSAVLSALMMISVCCVVIVTAIGTNAMTTDTPAFEIIVGNTMSDQYVDYLPNPPLSAQSIAQLKNLPNVKKVVIERNLQVLILLDEKCDYLRNDNIAFYTKEAYLAEKKDYWGADMLLAAEYNWEHATQEYDKIRRFFGIEKELAATALNTVVLDQETLAKLSSAVVDGTIDVDAINAGNEVIVVAPNLWRGVSEYGNYSYTGPVQKNQEDILAAENDCFYAGQTLPLLQLYYEDEKAQDYALAQRSDTTVTVGAVVNDFDTFGISLACILTTEEGLQNTGLYANGYDWYNIFLDGDIDLETEERLMQRITAIAERSGDVSVDNNLESHRESERIKRQLLVIFLAITIVFASVAVSMIVTSFTRRLQADGHRIGMLRAVGADEKTITNCYSGQIGVSILAGVLVTSALFGMLMVTEFMEGLELYALRGLSAMAVLGAISWGICRLILKYRIREIINRSIIDNIREL